MLYVLSRTVGQSRNAGIASALGLCLGGIVLAVLTAFGLASLFAAFQGLTSILSVAGAAYLGWLGVAIIRESWTKISQDNLADYEARPLLQVFMQGVLVEILNPKTVLFFALFLPPFIAMDSADAGRFEVAFQLLVLGALVPLTAVPADLLVAFMGTALTKRLNENLRAQAALSWFGGAVLVCIALSLLWQVSRGL